MAGPAMPAIKVVKYGTEDGKHIVREGWRQTKAFCGACGKPGVWSGPEEDADGGGFRLCLSCGMIGEANAAERFPEPGSCLAAALAQLRATA